MAAPKVKLLIETCGRCGDTLVNDNRGLGKPFLHLGGEPADGHYPHHGVVLDREQIIASITKYVEPEPEEEDAEHIGEIGSWVMPPPEIPGRPATEEEIGTSNRIGRRIILNACERNEFVTDVRYSRGWIADQWGRPKRITDSIGIFGAHIDGRRFHAWWIEDSKGVLEFQNARCYGLLGFHGQRELVRYINGLDQAQPTG